MEVLAWVKGTLLLLFLLRLLLVAALAHGVAAPLLPFLVAVPLDLPFLGC